MNLLNVRPLMKKRAILYIRVSTDEQAEKGNSLKHQEERLRQYCDLNQIEIDSIVKEDFSAKTFERPAFGKLLSYVKLHKKTIDVLLILKWDRFSRNISESYHMLSIFKSLGIDVQAVEQPLDLKIPENKIMLAFYLAAPEVENDRRGINTKMGLRRCHKDGRWTGVAPKGYKNSRDGSNKPLIVPGEDAPLVQEAFQLFVSGLYNVEELRRIMIGKGLKLQKSQFPKILENPLYMGKVLIPAYGNEEAELVDGIHQAIISEDLYYKVQSRLKNKRYFGLRYQKQDDKAPLRSFLICPRCGRKLTSSASTGRSKSYAYYHCKSECKERIRVELAHSALSDYFQRIQVAPEVAELYLEVMKDINTINQKKLSLDAKIAKEQLRLAEEDLDNLEMKYISGKLDDDSYARMKPKIKSRIRDCQMKLDEFQTNDKEFMKQIEFSLSLLQNLDSTYLSSPDDIKPKIIDSIFPEKLSIIDNECRTARENEVIVAFRGFTKATEGGRNRKPSKGRVFPVLYTEEARPRTSLLTIWLNFN
jgi:site-specific DNA recombinase